jgi:hypothetical protein
MRSVEGGALTPAGIRIQIPGGLDQQYAHEDVVIHFGQPKYRWTPPYHENDPRLAGHEIFDFLFDFRNCDRSETTLSQLLIKLRQFRLLE